DTALDSRHFRIVSSFSRPRASQKAAWSLMFMPTSSTSSELDSRGNSSNFAPPMQSDWGLASSSGWTAVNGGYGGYGGLWGVTSTAPICEWGFMPLFCFSKVSPIVEYPP